MTSTRPLLGRCAAALALLFACTSRLRADSRFRALSESQRSRRFAETRYWAPADCLLLFVKFMDVRVAGDQRTCTPRLANPVASRILTTCSSSSPPSLTSSPTTSTTTDPAAASSIRKALPKIIEATERWSSALCKAPPEDPAYDVARKIALESVRDLRESSTQLSADQAALVQTPSSRQARALREGPADRHIPR